MSAVDPAAQPLDLGAIRARWSKICPPCDAGYPAECNHPAEDPRGVILSLLSALEQATAKGDEMCEYGYQLAGKYTDLCRDMGKVQQELATARRDAEQVRAELDVAIRQRHALTNLCHNAEVTCRLIHHEQIRYLMRIVPTDAELVSAPAPQSLAAAEDLIGELNRRTDRAEIKHDRLHRAIRDLTTWADGEEREDVPVGEIMDAPQDWRWDGTRWHVVPAGQRAPTSAPTQVKLPVCAECGHRHRWGGDHSDHMWRDSCGYDAGADCTAAPQADEPQYVDFSWSADELAECQRTGTCCVTCHADLGTCCTHKTEASADERDIPCSTCGGTGWNIPCTTCDDTGWVTQEAQFGTPGTGCTHGCPDCKVGRERLSRRELREEDDGEQAAVPVPANELPGMWEDADLTGGQTDAEPVPASGDTANSGEQDAVPAELRTLPMRCQYLDLGWQHDAHEERKFGALYVCPGKRPLPVAAPVPTSGDTASGGEVTA